MKIQNLSITAFALLCSLGFQMALAAEECNVSLFAGGTGEEASPYEISTPEQLQNLCLGESFHYILTKDIDLSETDWQPIGNNSSHSFSGKLDGKGHKVFGLNINNFSAERVGLFGYVASGAELKNIMLNAGTVRGLDNVGGLVGENWGKISNNFVSGNVSGNENVGLIAGHNYGTISGSYARGNVFGNQYIGSLAGYNEGTISDCYANTAVVLGSNYVGGLAGYNKKGGKVKNNYFVGSVTPVTATCALVAGEPVVTCHPTELAASVVDFKNTYSVDGSYTISASKVVCGEVTPRNLPTCGTVIVEVSSSSEESSSSIEESSSSSVLVITPTCFIDGCYISSGSTVNVPPPTYSCGDGVIASGAKFSYTSGNHASVSSNAPDKWNDNYTAHGISTSTGTDRDVYMWNILCDGEQALPSGAKDSKDETLVIKCGTIHAVKTEAECPAGSLVFASSSSVVSSSSVNSSSSVVGAEGSSSSGATCAYQPDWCGGNGYEVTITKPTTVGKCIFVGGISVLTLASTGTNEILINGVSCSGTSKTCASSKPAAADGGYYIYLKAGSISSQAANYSVTAGSPNCEQGSANASSSSSTVSSSSQFTPITLALNPGRYISELNFNWYSKTGTGTDKSFVRLFKGDEHIEDFKGTFGEATSGYRYHQATVTGLDPDTEYAYMVSNDSTNWSPEYKFKTPPIAGPFKFAAISDIQPSCGTSDADCPESIIGPWRKIATKIKDAGATLIVNAGDHAEYGYENEFRGYFSPPELRSLPTAPVMGNHDGVVGKSVNFKYHFNLPNLQTGSGNYKFGNSNYYFLYNRVLFIGLNTSPYPSAPQQDDPSPAATYLADFRATIDAAKTAHNLTQYDFIVVTHHKSTNSVTSLSGHEVDEDVKAYVAAGLQKLMTEKGVDLVFTGHNHIYVRSQLMYDDHPSDNNTGTYYLTLKPAGITRNYAGNTVGWSSQSKNNVSYASIYPWFNKKNDLNLWVPESYEKHSLYGNGSASSNGDKPGYSIIEVNNGVMTVTSYEQDGTTIFDEFQVTPTLAKYPYSN